MDAKSILTSKTFWFNIAGAIWGVSTAAGVAPQLQSGDIGAIIAVGNLVLRWFTKQPVAITAP